MYSVYLLDDEPFILEGLKYILPWEEHGFEIVGSSNNGFDGYNEIINKNIDLIITDIMMPKMTGLELIEELKKSSYESNFIVLSAFQEFEYAKKAISIGAENYLLKPIDTEELSNNLKTVYAKLKKKEKIASDDKLVKNNLLLSILTEEYSLDTEEKWNRLNHNFKSSSYAVAIIEFKSGSNDISKILKSCIDNKQFMYCIQSQSKALLIVDEDDKSLIIDKLTVLKNKIASVIEDSIYISSGKFVNSLNELHDSYQTANKISDYKIVYPNISWIKEYKDGSIDEDNINIEFEELKKILMNKDFSNTTEYIKDMFINLKNEKTSPKQIKMKAIEIFLNVYNYFNDTKLMKGLNIYLENTINNSTIDDIEFELISMVKYMQSKLENTEESISPVIIKLLKHIETNYKDDLNLKEISESLNINSIYLGQLFQKETGILFSDYINNFRINKAKDLLVNTSLKASEIGDLVGYANKNYFYRKFKNIVGVTPSDWRKINL